MTFVEEDVVMDAVVAPVFVGREGAAEDVTLSGSAGDDEGAIFTSSNASQR